MDSKRLLFEQQLASVEKLIAAKEEALEENVGGVGYYPKNNYIHVDTAEPRQW